MTAQIISLFADRDLFGERLIKRRSSKQKARPKAGEDAKKWYSKVLFVGGPMDGERRLLRPMATRYEFRFRPPNQPHVNAFYEVAVETQDGGEFHFVGFDYAESGEGRK